MSGTSPNREYMREFIDTLINEDIPTCPRPPRLRSVNNEDFITSIELDESMKQLLTKTMGKILHKYIEEMITLYEGGIQDAKEYSDVRNKPLYDRIEELEKANEKLAKDNDVLRNEIDNIGQYSRRDNIKIVGVPVETDEDLNQIVIDIVKHTGVDLKAEDIDITHRLNTKDDAVSNTNNSRGLPKKIPSIFCKLRHRSKKAEIFVAKKNIREKNATAPHKKAAIYEDVTPLRSRIMYALRNRMENDNKKYLYVWSRDGRIFCRTEAESKQRVTNPITGKEGPPKPHIVNKVQDLEALGWTMLEIEDIACNRIQRNI